MAEIAQARLCAYAVLRRVFEQGAYADRAFHAMAGGLGSRDRALAMRISYGAVQRRGTLDYLIELLTDRASARLERRVLAALRLGLYELLYLDGAPDRAVVADCVELVKRQGSSGGALVNAVLRRAASERESLLAGLGEETPERAAVMHSHPSWIAQLWWSELGREDALALMATDNEPAEIALRVNTLVADRDLVEGSLGVRCRRDERLPEALVLEEPFDLTGSALWREGAVLAQSRGAMLVSRVLDPKRGERVLDLCAAPGGKSTHIAALMEGEGTVVAVERHPRRAAALVETVKRLHASCVEVKIDDAARVPPGRGSFDRVLVDPPCSGLGVLQARPDLRWRATPERAAELAALQRQILDRAVEALRPGGVLVYSTCTVSPTENERQISAFLESTPDFALENLGAELPALSRGRCVLTLPHRDRTAGFFIARLRRG